MKGGGTPEGWEPEGWSAESRKMGPRRVGLLTGGGAQNFTLFSLSRHNFHSLGVFSWNFGGVLNHWNPQMCTFGVHGQSCEAPTKTN